MNILLAKITYCSTKNNYYKQERKIQYSRRYRTAGNQNKNKAQKSDKPRRSWTLTHSGRITQQTELFTNYQTDISTSYIRWAHLNDQDIIKLPMPQGRYADWTEMSLNYKRGTRTGRQSHKTLLHETGADSQKPFWTTFGRHTCLKTTTKRFSNLSKSLTRCPGTNENDPLCDTVKFIMEPTALSHSWISRKRRKRSSYKSCPRWSTKVARTHMETGTPGRWNLTWTNTQRRDRHVFKLSLCLKKHGSASEKTKIKIFLLLIPVLSSHSSKENRQKGAGKNNKIEREKETEDGRNPGETRRLNLDHHVSKL